MLYTENHYAEYYYHILGTKIIARKKIILPGIHDKINMTPAYLVLSALNSKDYIESLFQIRIPDSYHFGKDDNGKILLNRFPNVVCTTYVRGAYNTDKYKQPGYGINRTVSYQARNEIAKRIITFLEAFKDEKVAIGGAKNTFKLLTLESFDPNNSIQNMDKPVCHGINDYISTTGHGKQIVSYNKYRMLKEENRKSCIPYVHFGISGTNDLTDFRAILIINRFQISPHLNKIYCDTKHDEFAISDNSFHFNMDIAPARQLEGRLLRFCDNVQFKYIFRLNDYDKGYPGDLKGNRNGFPDCTTPLFEFKSQKLLDRCIQGLKEWNEYTSLSESVKESVNTNLWGNIFDSLENGNRIYKDRRRMTYIITKYIEFYYKKREEYAKLENKNDTNDIPISIKDIDSDFFENYFLSTKNQRRYNENREKIYAVMHELIAGFPYLTELMN